MTNYYIEKDNKIIFVDTDLERLQNTVSFGEYANIEIKQTDRPIINFEFADTPEHLAEELKKAKELKLQELSNKTEDYLGEYGKAGEKYGNICLFALSETQHIEATKSNLSTFIGYLIGFDKGLFETVPWTTYENESLRLTFEDVASITIGIQSKQEKIWTSDEQGKKTFLNYLNAINNAQTLKEVEAIKIDYNGDKVSGT